MFDAGTIYIKLKTASDTRLRRASAGNFEDGDCVSFVHRRSCELAIWLPLQPRASLGSNAGARVTDQIDACLVGKTSRRFSGAAETPAFIQRGKIRMHEGRVQGRQVAGC